MGRACWGDVLGLVCLVLGLWSAAEVLLAGGTVSGALWCVLCGAVCAGFVQTH